MHPCKRRVHLHKSANFKTIFEHILTNHENNVDPKMIDKSIQKPSNKWFGKTLKHITPNTQQIQIWDPILEPVAWNFRLVARFVCDLFFRTSGGYTPLDLFWLLLRHVWSESLHFWRFQRQFCSIFSKNPEQQMASTTPSTNQKGIQTNFTDNQPHHYLFFNKSA